MRCRAAGSGGVVTKEENRSGWASASDEWEIAKSDPLDLEAMASALDWFVEHGDTHAVRRTWPRNAGRAGRARGVAQRDVRLRARSREVSRIRRRDLGSLRRGVRARPSDRHGANYDEEQNRKQFDAALAKGVVAGGITIATVYKGARMSGWRGVQRADVVAKEKEIGGRARATGGGRHDLLKKSPKAASARC